MKETLPLERTSSLLGFFGSQIAAKGQSISLAAGEQTFARHLDRQAVKATQTVNQPKETQKNVAGAVNRDSKGIMNPVESQKVVSEEPAVSVQSEGSLVISQEKPGEDAPMVSAEAIQNLLQMLSWLQQQAVTTPVNTEMQVPVTDEITRQNILSQIQEMGIDLKELKQVLESAMQSKDPQMAVKSLPQEVVAQVDSLLKAMQQMEAKTMRNVIPTENTMSSNSAPSSVLSQTPVQSEFDFEDQFTRDAKAEGKEISPRLEGETRFVVDNQPVASELKPVTQLAGPQSTPVDFELEISDPQRLIDQIVKNMELVQKSGATEMRIQLKPEFLGKMMVTLTVQEGVLTAKFITESHQVKGLLEANMQALKQNLEANGIRVEKAEVGVQVNTGGAFEREFASHQGENAWAEAAAHRDGYMRPAWVDSDTQIENHYALQMEAETDFYPASETIFAAGKMNLVI